MTKSIVTVTLLTAAAQVSIASAQAPRPQVVSPEVTVRPADHPAPLCAHGAAGGRQRGAGWKAASSDEGQRRRLDGDDRTTRSRHLHLRLQRGRRHCTRSAERQHEVRIRQLRSGEHRAGARRHATVLRRQGRAARRSADQAVHVEGARRQPHQSGSTRHPTTTRGRTSPSSTCCTAPATSSPAGR